jgi:SAM-dependent methyltransferase
MPKSVEDVREFWENNPLFTGESRFQTGSREYFDEHAGVVVEDGFAGEIDEHIFPARGAVGEVLDLGCGPGFWTAELAKRGFRVTAADLTKAALELTRERCEALGFSAKLSLQLRDVDEIVRLYDGRDNPIGKCFTRQQFISMLEPYFTVLETYLHFFPARTLPLRLPKWLHRLLDRRAGFLIYAKVVKRYPCAEFAEFSTQRMTRSRAGQS